MRSLSSTVRLTPSSCEPSRNVVSKTSTAFGVRGFLSVMASSSSSLLLVPTLAPLPAAGSGDVFDPVLVAIDLTPDRLRVLGGDRRRHRPGAVDLPVVHRVDRADLGSGAA